uniref:Histidine ammonia-lyase-like n=1 Tax=Sinocyclocheilus grahami TaxID=75366 RepID=A0A672M8I4_SINGR
MPRFTVHVRDEWLTVPCKDATCSIKWLGFEALKRYIKNKPDNGGIQHIKDVRFVVRRCQGLGLLDSDDTVEDVLEDNDFVELAIEGDTMSQDFIPSQPGTSHLYLYIDNLHYISLDGNSLTSTDLVNLGKGLYKIKLSPEAEQKVVQSRELLDTIVKENKVVYGITTGFGKFARTVIPVSKLKELQENLLRSHSSGLGSPLSPERTRMLLALRINVLAKGYSGVSLETLHRMIHAFNASCLSYVPEKGTVGASGDLAPLSHLALGLMGEGKMWSPKSGWADAKYVLEAHGLKPISLKPKEGLALINGTQMITSLGAEAVERWATRHFTLKLFFTFYFVIFVLFGLLTTDLQIHIRILLAIELLAACQGIEFLRPLRTTTPLEKVYDLVRATVKPWIKDRFMAPDIEAVHRLLVDQKVWNIAGPYIEKYCMEYIPESRPSSPTAFALDPPPSPRKRVRLE